MRATHGAMLLGLLWLGGCSCHREPQAPDAIQTPAEAPATSSDADTVAKAAHPPSDARAQHARAAAFSAAVATVHRYLGALPGDTATADALWSGGQPAPSPDDANLRALSGLRSLRIRSDMPVALDDKNPPESIEVPVRLTADTGEGHPRYTGWYRLRPRADGDGWEITAASLQPALD